MTLVEQDNIHPDFLGPLEQKAPSLQMLYASTRNAVLSIYPNSNELLYHTHALSSVYSVSSKLKHAFCHIAIYSSHLNLGFNSGTELEDPDKILKGTGARIRHVPIKSPEDLKEPAITAMLERAVKHALSSVGGAPLERKSLISKIR
ncbi:MAG: DUF1801 domain-containing protein [Pseudomonadota bacterium]